MTNSNLASEHELCLVARYHERIEAVFGHDYTRDNRYQGLVDDLVEGRRTVSNIFADYTPANEEPRKRWNAW